MTVRPALLAWRTVGGLVRAFALCFCLGPALLVIGLSFFADALGTFPPKQPSLLLYSELFSSSTWGHAFVVSLEICVPSSLLAIALVVPTVVALARGRVVGRSLIEGLTLVPLLVPATSYAVSIYLVYLDLGLVGQIWSLVLVEAVMGVPVAYLVLRAAVRNIGRRLEFTAMSLGASKFRAICDTTLRLAVPGVLAGFIFAFLTAFDDALYVTFLGGPNTNTVSESIFSSLRYELDPRVAPLSALMMVVTAGVVTAVSSVRSRGGER